MRVSKMQQRLNNKINPALGRSSTVGLRARAIEKQSQPLVALSSEKRNVLYMSAGLARIYPFQPDDVLISISDIDATPPAFRHNPKEILRLNFNAYADAADIKAGRRSFNDEDAAKIYELLARNTDKGNVIVHCTYGEQRSRAIATSISNYYGYSTFTFDDSNELIKGSGERMNIDIERIGYSLFRYIAEHDER